MTEELKPCPFCGGDDVEALDMEGKHYVVCYDCALEGPFHDSRASVVEACNRRADLHAASGETFDGLTLDQVKASLSLLKEDDLRGLVVSLLIQQRIAERAFAATQPA